MDPPSIPDPTFKTAAIHVACESKASVLHTGASCQPERDKPALGALCYVLQNMKWPKIQGTYK